MSLEPQLALADAEPLPTAARARVLAYLGALVVLLGLGSPAHGLIDLPVSFFLKNRLHLSAHEVATFKLIAAIPLYVSFVFGFLRDVWSPFGLRDRGYFMVFGGLCTAVYVIFALTPPTYVTLAAGVMLATTAFLLVSSAQHGLASAIGKQHVMSGQVSAVWNIFLALPIVAAFFFGGALSGQIEGQGAQAAGRTLFLVGAAIMGCVTLYGVFRPASVYDGLYAKGPVRKPLSELKRLLAHRPIYPVLAIWFLFCFAPGSGTALQYYLQNTLHATDAQWGAWNAIMTAGFLPTYFVFAFFCTRVPLAKLLFWGTVVAIPQFAPLLFVRSVDASLIGAFGIGLLGGVATAAYTDLLIRSAPKGLEGATLMISVSLYWLSARFGDVLGTWLYDRLGGFGICVTAITLVYALILPLLRLVPKALVATADGQSPPP